MSIDHYENFPVASLLCPPHLRGTIVAIYRFARTADDLADEGDAAPDQRLADLRAYGDDLEAIYADRPPSGRWQAVFTALDTARRRHDLPQAPLRDLLEAFIQDTGNPRYETRADLLQYCAHSANPVGRLLLHLYGIDDATARRQSDAICTALQLINFWQDCSVDLPRGRVYVPQEDARRHGVDLTDPTALKETAQTRALLDELCTWARALMESGAPLALRVPGRAGWELRLVVQGGLRVLERIERMNHSMIRHRPVLTGGDYAVMAWRAVGMRAAPEAGE